MGKKTITICDRCGIELKDGVKEQAQFRNKSFDLCPTCYSFIFEKVKRFLKDEGLIKE